MIKPACLNPGDTICIISPSSGIKNFPIRLERGIASLRNEGFEVILSKYAKDDFDMWPVSIQRRAEDLMTAFENKKVKCIMGSTGGYISNTILDILDYNIIRSNPKIFIGFSDITAILLSIYHKTNLITFHGPTLLPSFGDFSGIHPDTAYFCFKALMSHLPVGDLTDFDMYSDDNNIWDKEDEMQRSYKKSNGLQIINNGISSGYLCGGNLETLISILGTEYCPNFINSILFLEECNNITLETMRNLKTLEYHGIFQNINGLVFGRPYGYSDSVILKGVVSYLKAIGNQYQIPILFNSPIGHTEPKYTLPIGINAIINAEKGAAIQVIESAVN